MSPKKGNRKGKSRGAEAGNKTENKGSVLLERQRKRNKGVAGSRVLME